MNIERLVLLGQLKEAICGGLTTIEHCRELIDSLINMEKGNEYTCNNRSKIANLNIDDYHSFERELFNTYREAEAMGHNMLSLIKDYGQVTVADYYDMLGINSTFQQTKYGWTELNLVVIMKFRDKYDLCLPNPKLLLQQGESKNCDDPDKKGDNCGSNPKVKGGSEESNSCDDHNHITFSEYKYAEMILNHLSSMLEHQSHITINDLYRALNRPCYTDGNEWGWTQLQFAMIIRVPDGYKLILPQPKYIQTQEKGGQNNENTKMA
jgi:hypothetical protein